KTQSRSDLPRGVLRVGVLERNDCAYARILHARQQPLDHGNPCLALCRLVSRWDHVEAQLRRSQQLLPPRLLDAAAAAEIGSDGEEPAAKPVRFLELPKR